MYDISIAFVVENIETLVSDIRAKRINVNRLNCFFSGITRMELLLDNVTLQIYVLHTPGYIQVSQTHRFTCTI